MTIQIYKPQTKQTYFQSTLSASDFNAVAITATADGYYAPLIPFTPNSMEFLISVFVEFDFDTPDAADSHNLNLALFTTGPDGALVHGGASTANTLGWAKTAGQNTAYIGNVFSSSITSVTRTGGGSDVFSYGSTDFDVYRELGNAYPNDNFNAAFSRQTSVSNQPLRLSNLLTLQFLQGQELFLMVNYRKGNVRPLQALSTQISIKEI